MKADSECIITVDDEQSVLDGLALTLRRMGTLHQFLRPAEALEFIKTSGPIALIISDMRMPEMDGAAFLTKARELRPDTIRMLLTGQADIAAAMAAINDGQIFRFLMKPCPPPALMSAVEAAIEQRRLITAEKELLQKTLYGAVSALSEVLSLASPITYGRATATKNLVAELCAQLNIRNAWQVEIAALLSQIGNVGLSDTIIEKLHKGEELTPEEAKAVERSPEVTDRLLCLVPRLDRVREIIRRHRQPYISGPDPDQVLVSAQILRSALDFEMLAAKRGSHTHAIAIMGHGTHKYDPKVLEALAVVRSAPQVEDWPVEVPVTGLKVGMVLADDLLTVAGMLLAAKGHVVTDVTIERLRACRPGLLQRQPVVISQSAAAA